jgi:hypothetical protein
MLPFMKGEDGNACDENKSVIFTTLLGVDDPGRFH